MKFKAAIFVKNEDESKAVQGVLFGAGFKWWCNGDKHDYIEYHFLVLCDNMRIMCSDSIKWVLRNIPHTYVFNAYEVIEDPNIIPGAKNPEKTIMVDGKEYSESTIKAALREHVK